MQWIFIILTLSITLFVVAHFYNSLPKWKRVKFHICSQFMFGSNYVSIKLELMEKFDLNPKQADLCLNNYQDDDWMQMQSFLEDKEK